MFLTGRVHHRIIARQDLLPVKLETTAATNTVAVVGVVDWKTWVPVLTTIVRTAEGRANLMGPTMYEKYVIGGIDEFAKAFSTGDSELENSLFQFLNTLFSDRECANRILLSDVRPIEKLAQVALPEKRGESTAIRYYPTIAGSPNAQRLLLTIYPLSYFGDWDVDHWLMNKCPNYCQLVKFNQGQKVLANIGMADSPLFDVEDFCRRYERHDNRHPVKKLLDMTKAKSDVEFLMTSGLYTRYVIKLPMELANSITNNNKKLTREIHLFLRILSANPVARIRMVNDLSFIESLSTAAESGQEARNIIGIIFNNLYDPRKGIDAELEKKWLTCDTYVKYLNANLQRLFKEGNPQYFSDTFGSSHGKVLTNSDQILESERYKIAKSILDRRAAWTRAGTAAPSIGVFGSIPTIAAIMRILATPDLTRRSNLLNENSKTLEHLFEEWTGPQTSREVRYKITNVFAKILQDESYHPWLTNLTGFINQMVFFATGKSPESTQLKQLRAHQFLTFLSLSPDNLQELIKIYPFKEWFLSTISEDRILLGDRCVDELDNRRRARTGNGEPGTRITPPSQRQRTD